MEYCEANTSALLCTYVASYMLQSGGRKLSTTERAQQLIKTHFYGEEKDFYGVTVKTGWGTCPLAPCRVPLPMKITMILSTHVITVLDQVSHAKHS